MGRLPHWASPNDPWGDDVPEMFQYVPATAAWPEAYVDEDKVDRIPFGFQRPRKPTPARQRSRQAAARAHHARRPR